MNFLRICRVTTALYPDAVGGHAVFCHDLTTKQAAMRYRVNVLTPLRNGFPRHQTVTEGYDVTRLPRVWMPWDSIGLSNPVTPSLYGIVHDLECDLVDAHSQLFWMTAISVKAAVDSEKPVITTVHGFLALRDWLANSTQRAYLWTVGAWALRNSSRVICLTEADARAVMGLGVPRDKIRVIPIAVDTGFFKPMPSKRRNIVWVGRFVPEKDVETLVRAVAVLQRSHQVCLTLVGDGPLRTRVMALVRRLGISQEVTFLHEATRSEVAKILAQSQIFVLPSRREGLPTTLLEAMASANTILASDLPMLREVLDEAGFYFTPGDHQELAYKLKQALNNPELAMRLGREARATVQERFTWNNVLNKLESLYRELVAS